MYNLHTKSCNSIQDHSELSAAALTLITSLMECTHASNVTVSFRVAVASNTAYYPILALCAHVRSSSIDYNPLPTNDAPMRHDFVNSP